MGISLIMSSRHSGGSRFPSAYGHTPSYRSYASIPDSSVGEFTRDLTRDLGIGSGSTAGVSAFNRNPTSLLADTDLHLPLRSTGAGTTSQSSQKVSSYSSSYSSTSGTGSRPVTEYSSDSMYKATATGPSGIPHTSY